MTSGLAFGRRLFGGVPAGEPSIDGSFQFLHGAEGSAPYHLIGDEPEPAFHLIEPGTAGGREVKVDAVVFLGGLEPTLDLGALVSAVRSDT